MMEDSPEMLGRKGLIKKHEMVRIIIQCLCSLGYRESAACLESESGISYKSLEFELLKSKVLHGSWDDCIDCLSGIKGLTDEMRASALFLVFKQYLMEYISLGDDSLALSILRKQISDLRLGKDKVHKLAFGILSMKDIELGKIDEAVVDESRKKMLKELEKVLPPPITMPERRLEHLVEMTVGAQIDSCIYHNSNDSISLYEDHRCGRDQIPTETIQILTNHNNEVWFVQFSNSGDYLASSSSDCTAIIWEGEKNFLSSHLWEVGHLIFTGLSDSNCQSGEVLADNKVTLKHKLKSHHNPVSFVSWSPNDKMLLTCGNGEVLKLWEVETGNCQHTFGNDGFFVGSCAWFPDSKRLVCGCSDPEKGIYLWDTEGNEIRAWKGMRMPKVLDLAVTPDGENLVSVFSEKEVRILNLETNAEIVVSEEHTITSLSVSGDSRFLVVNLNNQEIHVWDVAGKWERPFKYKGHTQLKYVIRSCFGGLNSSFIASGSEDSKVYIWNRRSPDPIEVLSGHLSTVNCVSWNPKRPQMLASASDDQTIRIWGPEKKLV